MRTTINIDDKLMRELMQVERVSNRSEAIRRAVEGYLQFRRISRFKTLAGSHLSDLDWKQIEQEEMDELERNAAAKSPR